MPPGRYLSWLGHNKFFETTCIFGLNLIQSAKNKYEAGFWYIVVFISLSLTMKNVIFLITKYSSGETVTSMRIGRSDLALFPNMTFCIQMQLPEVNPEFLTRNVSLLANVSALQEEVDEALANFVQKQDLLQKPWNYIMVPLLFRYFSSMRLLEVDPGFLRPKTRFILSGRVLKTFLEKSPKHSIISKAVFSILNHSRSLGVTDYEMLEKLSEELVALMEFKARYQERTLYSAETWTLKPKIKLLFFKESALVVHGFCFDYEPLENMSTKHERNQYHVKSRLDFTISIKTRDKILHNNYGLSMGQLAEALRLGGKYKEQNMEKLEVLMKDEFGVTEFIDYPILSTEISATVRAHVTTTAVYQSIVNCSPNKTKEHCITQCKKDIISNACGCSPLLWLNIAPPRERHHSQRMCKLEDYIDCLKPSMVELYDNCMEKCLSACFHVKYSLTPHTVRKYANYDKAKIYIYRKENEYPIFMESYAKSFESLFGELGGTLGFYLDASLLALLHLMVYILKQIIYLRSRNQSAEKQGHIQEMKRDDQTTTMFVENDID